MTTTEPVAVASGGDVPAAPRIMAAWVETGGADLDAHLGVHGPLSLPTGNDAAWADRLVEAVRSSGLTGRGGAGFPTARKWDAIRAGHGRPLLAVNAMEGEPASVKDRALLSAAPHLVLDGADLVARAIGAADVVLCVAHDRNESAESVWTALVERDGVVPGDPPVRLLRPPGRYVTGEESALVAWLAGGPALPQFRASKSTPLTIRRRPVLVQSAETLAHVALIARYGPAWFRSAGLPDAAGTCLVTASGSVDRPGVYEVELGTPVGAILRQAGLEGPVGAVLVGGYGGAWLPGHRLDTAYAPAPLAAAGCAVGAGVLAVIPASSCGIAETARIAVYMADQSAGQCGPCVFGLPALAQDLAQLARGIGDRQTVMRLRHRLGTVEGRGACRHPDGVVRLVRSALDVFADDVAQHARCRPCLGWNRKPILPIPRSAPVKAGRRR
ncbi:MAG TPA: NADH-ubiquinone oxidoreductase-F iron-sulfur binding region domain-containing protein [Acidimicrobiales bacterium]|nr:NADH-ubiquinone oxidoreductase-F iron-sulfur binding region domain-containing protein [Acidimicrobiales bacterium]